MGIRKCLLMLAHLLTQATQALRNLWMSLMVKGFHIWACFGKSLDQGFII